MSALAGMSIGLGIGFGYRPRFRTRYRPTGRQEGSRGKGSSDLGGKEAQKMRDGEDEGWRPPAERWGENGGV